MGPRRGRARRRGSQIGGGARKYGGGTKLGMESEWVVVRARLGGAYPMGGTKLWAEPGETSERSYGGVAR